MRSVRVVSTGPTGLGTQITDSETGVSLGAVRSVHIDLTVDKPNVATLVMTGAEIDINGQAAFEVVDPRDGKPKTVKMIVFADGTEFTA